MRPGQSGAPSIEDELALRLAQIADMRTADEPTIRALLDRVEYDRLIGVLVRQGLLPLLGARLEAIAGDDLPPEFLAAVQRSIGDATRRATLYESVSDRISATLDRAGIASLPLKGPHLSRALYGNPGMRGIPVDIDLLVSPDEVGSAKDAVCELGYERSSDSTPVDGMPQLHFTLLHAERRLPRVELHWRIHWYETRFASEMLRRSVVGEGGARRPRPADELAALLLFFSRDGFLGLRLATDIAAWWDAHGGRVDRGALQPIVEAHPELRPAITTAACVAHDLVGLPAARLLRLTPSQGRTRIATRLANWTLTGDRDQLGANVSLVDWLLSPPGELRPFVRRQLIREVGEGEAAGGSRGGLVAARATAAHSAKRLVRFVIALWTVRRGRSWAPRPEAARSTIVESAS